MKNQYKSLVTASIVLGILIAGYFGTWTQWGKLTDSRLALEAVEQENQRLLDTQAKIATFLASYEQNRDRARLADLALPLKDPDTAILLDNVSRLVSDSGMSLVQLSLGVPEQGTDAQQAANNSVQSIEMDIQANGSYEAFEGLLLRLQNNLRLMDITRVIAETGEDESGSSGNMKFSLKVVTYYQKQ